MLDQPFHNGGESDQDVHGKSVQTSSNNWSETDDFEVQGNEADVHVAQNLMENNVMNKDCEMPQSQKFVLDKRDNKMDSDCMFLIKQKEMSPESELHSHADVSCRSTSKTSKGCSDKLSIDEDLEATIKLQQEHCGSKSKDVEFGDFFYVATSDTDEEIKSEIEQNGHWEGEKSGDNTPGNKLSSTSSVMDCSVHCIRMNSTHSDIEVTDVDGDVVLHSESFENQRVKKCSNILDDYLQTSNGSDDVKMKADRIDAEGGVVSSNLESDILPLNDLDSAEDWYLAQTSLYDNDDVKMKADQNDNKKEPLHLLDVCTEDDISLELPWYSNSLAAEGQQKQGVSGIEADRGAVSSSLESDILPLNVLDSAEDLYLAQTSLYDSSQSMHDSSQSMHDSSQSALCLAASTSFGESISQDGNASDIADSRENSANTDSGYFSTACDLIEINSEYGVSIEPDDSLGQQEKTAVNYPERDSAARPCNLQLGYMNSAADTLSLSLLLSPVGSSTSASEPHTVDHPLSNGEKQQLKSPHSQHCSSSSEVSAAETLEMERNSTDFSDMGKCTANEISTLPSLSTVLASSPSCSYDSQEPLPGRRHIKSIFNTYMNHRLKADVCNDGVNDIADELAFILKGSRKRAGVNENPSTTKVKKPCLDETDSASNSNDSKQKSEQVDGSCAWSRNKVKRTVQHQDAALVLCSMCDTSSPSALCGQCQNAHAICKSCLEDQVRLVMASDKLHLSCPEMSCSATIPLDSLSPVLPSLVVDVLSDNLRLKAQKATTEAMKKMQGLVMCPRCACPGMLDKWTLQFVCTSCNSNCCHYCKAAWLSYEEHDGCFLLSFVGAECLKNIVKVPRNWDMTITAFNKNYLQVNVPLSSAEGSTVAAFFAKTASYGANVVQVFRIQNKKLWEKYVLKRKHVEEEIGAEELKEKFLFHGTRAENIVNICSEGFDIRVPTANGALLGKGIYFSTTAKYSERYTDKSHMMFLTRVICGWSQQGQKLLMRPDYHSTVRRMYDTCVNNITSPTIFTVFDNSQCYPEYLIHFGY